MKNEDLNTIIFYAFRYAIGRRTYISMTMSNLIKDYWPLLERRTKIQIQKEVKEALRMKSAGGKCDEEEWKKLLELEW